MFRRAIQAAGRGVFEGLTDWFVTVHDVTGAGTLGRAPRNAVLMYHAVGEPVESGYFGTVSTERFRETVRYLDETREIVPLSEITETGPTQRVAITFDDGLKSVYTQCRPVLEAFDAPATVFVNPGFVGDPDSELIRERLRFHQEWDRIVLTESELRELAADPLFTIGNHTYTHPDLATVTDEAVLRREIVGARDTLSATYGVEVDAFAYPYGASNDRARRLVEQTHDYSVTTDPFLVDPSRGSHGIGRLSAQDPDAKLRWELTPASDYWHRIEYWGAGASGQR